MSLQCNSRRLILIDQKICMFSGLFIHLFKSVYFFHEIFCKRCTRIFYKLSFLVIAEWIIALLRLAIKSTNFDLAEWNGRRNRYIEFLISMPTRFKFFETCFRRNAGKYFCKLLPNFQWSKNTKNYKMPLLRFKIYSS